MLKTLLLINEITCRIGNKILLVVICWFSALRACVITLVVTGCVSTLPHAPARAHYFARYLTVTIKIRTLKSISAVALAGSIVWWDST